MKGSLHENLIRILEGPTMFRKLSLFAFLISAPLFCAEHDHTELVHYTITQENVNVLPGPARGHLPTGWAAWPGNCWAQVTVPAATTISPVSMSNQYAAQFPFADPCPGIVKEFDVLETAAAQTVSVTNSTGHAGHGGDGRAVDDSGDGGECVDTGVRTTR